MSTRMPDHFKPQHHPEVIPGYAHYACEEPEHPHCQMCAYSEFCQWCMLKVEIAVAAGNDYYGLGTYPESERMVGTTLKSWYEAHKSARGIHDDTRP